MEDLPLDLQAAVFDCLDDRDRSSLLLSNPVGFIDAYKVCPRISFTLHDYISVEQAVAHFKSIGGTHTLSLVSDGLHNICLFLREVGPVNLRALSITVRDYTTHDSLYSADTFATLEGDVETIDIFLSTVDEDDVTSCVFRTCPLMHSARTVKLRYPLGTISTYHLVLPKCRHLEIHATKVSRSIWSTKAPSLQSLTIRGSIARCREGLGSERLLRNVSLGRMCVEVENQEACELLLHLLRFATRVDNLVIIYSMPICINVGVPSVCDLLLHSTFSMSLDVEYPVLVDEWTNLKRIALARGMVDNCLFAIRFLDTSVAPIQTVMRTLVDRFDVQIPDDVNLEIDRF